MAPAIGRLNVLYIVFLFCKLLSIGLVITSNFIAMLSYGQGAAEGEVLLWRQCTTTACTAITSNGMCSELASRLKVAIAFGLISALSSLGVMIVVLAERHGITLTRFLDIGLLGWALLSDIIVISILVSTLVARLCQDPVPLRERGGGPAAGFTVVVLTLVSDGMAAGLLVWARQRDRSSVDEESDRHRGFRDDPSVGDDML